MRNIIRKVSVITALLVIMAFLFTTVNAEGEDLGYNTFECQELAVKNSRQALADDLEIKAKESALRKAEEDKYKAGPGYSPSQALENKIWIEVKPLRAEADLEAAKKAKEDNIKALELDVYKTVLHILLANEEISLENERLSILSEKYRIAKTKYDIDMITENELHDIEHSVEIKKNDIESIEDKLKSYDLELKKLMNLPFEGELIKVRSGIRYMQLKSVNIDEAVKEAVKNSTEVFIKGKELEAMEITMKWTKEYLPEGNYTYDDNSSLYLSTKTAYEDSVRNLEVSVRNKYNDLLNHEDAVDITQKYEDLMKKKVEVYNTKLEVGTISKEELLTMKEKYYEAAYQKLKAVHDYNIARMEFENIVK